jgi:hypothetical protein
MDIVKQELDLESRDMYDERKSWLAKGGGVDNESKDLLTILSEFYEP